MCTHLPKASIICLVLAAALHLQPVVALDGLSLDADPMVHLLDLTNDFVNADGTLKKDLFSPDAIHLTQEGGYELYAVKLKPVLARLLAR